MIRLEHVSLSYHNFSRTILHDISWRIGDDETWVLFGPNGSGKTKLLEIIAGYIHPSGGSVRRFGETGGYDIREAWKRIGYVSTPMRERFRASERVVDLVTSGAYATAGLYAEPEKADVERGRGLIAAAGMAGVASLPFGVLSDGEKQKILMLRSLMTGPELMILDEPSMGLDISAREDLLASLESLCHGKKISVIYVTHHTEEITPFFRSIFMLKNGRCLFNGAVRNGISDAILSDIFDRSIRIIRTNGRYYTTLE
jgi:iron complex transport system ATP-binding protein